MRLGCPSDTKSTDLKHLRQEEHMVTQFWRRFWPGLLAASIVCSAQTWAAELENVAVKSFTSRGFKLENGQLLPELTIAYETYGTLAPDGRNAVLITHGYTNNFHAAG